MSERRYVVLWIECDDDQDAEDLEPKAVAALERIAQERLVQNRIQDSQP